MKNILIISLNSGGTMGHGKIISSLANYLTNKKKEVTILSDMPVTKNFDLDRRVIKKNIKMVPHENYTVGGMCHCSQKDEIFNYAIKNNIEYVIFSTFFDLNLVKKFKEASVKTILLSYPIRDTYRLALKQNGAYTIFDKLITLYDPCFTDKKMKNEVLVNSLNLLAFSNVKKTDESDILVTCGGGGRPSSKIFLRKVNRAFEIIAKMYPEKKLRIKIIKGNSKVDIKNKNIETIIWTKNFASLLSSSKVIISEAGFYTMLDLINYRKKAILVPGERIIDNQELRALKLEEVGIGSVFFPFEKSAKLAELILYELDRKSSDGEIFDRIKKDFQKYQNLEEEILKELK